MEELKTQAEQMAVMVTRRKAQLAQLLNNGEEVLAMELMAVAKLEVQLANLRAMLRLREMTRAPRP